MVTSTLANAAPAVPDSIFTWTFTANSGDSWGGTLVEDSTRYAVGAIQATAFGRYTIVAAAPQLADLSASGFDEGWISVGWYRDSSGAWMLTRAGEATAAGSAGLGSELDAAWNGQAWDSFGRGGADQADPSRLADARFTFRFTATGGDLIEGVLYGNGAVYSPNDLVATSNGAYRILTETAYTQDQNAPMETGTVYLTRYYDASARIDFTLESAGLAPVGYAGLGSELDRAWNGRTWMQVGQGGALQANRQPDRIFDWTFEAPNGDHYGGRLVGHSTAMVVGDTIAGAAGTYLITSASPIGSSTAADGTVWTNDYYDASEGRWLVSFSRTVQGGAPTGSAGLGSEYDYAWDGDEWDDFGHGGLQRATVDRDSVYAWRFNASNGDRYDGWLVQDAELYQPGDTIAGVQGRFTIDAEYGWGGGANRGTIYTTSYQDAAAGITMPTYHWGTRGGQPSGSNGFGSEYDYAWDGDEWSDFGAAGANLANAVAPEIYRWRLAANNGDSYYGWVVEDINRYQVDEVVTTSTGRFTIEAKYPWGGSAPIGSTYTTSYYDSSADAWMKTYSWGTRGGVPNGSTGLGGEYDYAWNGKGWDDFGYGGALQASIERLSVYSWYFTATNGDRWYGWLVETFERYRPGDTVTTANGRYLVDAKYDWGGATSAGATYTTSYYDASADNWMQTYSWGTQGGVPNGSTGLGGEYDYAWNGRGWDDFGGGGRYLASLDNAAPDQLMG